MGHLFDSFPIAGRGVAERLLCNAPAAGLSADRDTRPLARQELLEVDAEDFG